MTVSATHRFNSFIPNGVVLVFGFTFRCDDVAWVSVLLDNVVVGGYTVLLNVDQTASPGGTVTFAVAPVGTLLVVKRDTQLTQTTVYNPYGRFPAKSHETALDKLTLQTQDFAELASRVAVAAIGSPPIVITYPPYVANKVWAWDPTVNGRVINTDGSVEAVNAAAASAAAALASQNAAAASANSAAASYDSFDDRYLGPKSSAPTLDNDGNALLVGALYWNTTNSTLHAWTGTAWVILVLDAAGLNVANIFTLAQTIQSAAPQQVFIETDAAADNRRWDIIAEAESLRIRTINDANNVAVDIIRAERTGTTIDSVTIGPDATINGVKVGRGAGGITSNTAVGASALNANTSGTNGTAIGSNALAVNTIGGANTAVGRSALAANIIGANNTAVGNSALAVNTNSNNTAVGNGALAVNTSGSENTAVGAGGLNANTTGSGNTAISPRDASGFYSPVFNPVGENNRFCLGSTGVTNAYVQVAWTVVSDARDKRDIGGVPHGLDFVSRLKPVSYRFKMSREDDTPNGPLRYGFLAQDILALEGPDSVIVDSEDAEKLRMVDQHMIAVMVKAIQELKAEFDAYKAARP